MPGPDELIVFVGSRMRQLRHPRACVEDALRRMYIRAFLYDHCAPASGHSVSQAMLDHVARADVFVALFEDEFSPGTVEEFRHARRLEKPCHVYLGNLGPGQRREPALEEFLQHEVLDPGLGVSCVYWDNAVDLAEKVGRDLMVLLVRSYRECSRQLPVAPLAPAMRLAIDVVDWLQAQDHEGVHDPEFIDRDTVDVLLRYRLLLPGEGPVYQDVLVRCVSGRVEAKEVEAFRRALDTSPAARGLMVSDLEFTPAARAEARPGGTTRRLSLATFDELIDQRARFDQYLAWLEQDIMRQGIDDESYLTLGCTSEEGQTDPERPPPHSVYPAEDGGIDRYVELWLRDERKEHLSILGEFGTGKTWFLFRLAQTFARRYLEARRRGLPRPRIPLVIRLRDFAKEQNIESLLLMSFFKEHNVGLPTYQTLCQLNRMGKLLLLFDGFDEMATHLDRQKMISSFWEFSRVLFAGSKAIITCRTEHFKDVIAGRALLRGQSLARVAGLTGRSPQFEVVELHRFTDRQVRLVLERRAGPEVTAKVLQREELSDLAHRPVMVGLIIEAVRDIPSDSPIDLARVFLWAVRRKLMEETRSERTFTSVADKLYFLCEISWEMVAHGRVSLNYREIPGRIRRLFGVRVREERDLDHWEHDLRGNSMLIRNENGDYSPAHRSLIEFFVAYKLVAEMGLLAPDFTDLARQQSHLDETQAPYSFRWSEYFLRERDPEDRVRPIAPLEHFRTEDYDQTASITVPGRSGPEPGQAFPDRPHDPGTPARVAVEKASKNVLLLASSMVSGDPASLDALCEMAWRRSGTLAWNALNLLPFLKYDHAEPLASLLIQKSLGRPLGSGVAWVLGELGIKHPGVEGALRGTLVALKSGTGASPAAWWEAGFALEKLGLLGARQGRQGAEALAELHRHLPPASTPLQALERLKANVDATEPARAAVNPCDVVALAVSPDPGLLRRFVEELLPRIDFRSDLPGRRLYFLCWLCGHLGIERSVSRLIEASRHPASSVRNCATEALGKIGLDGDDVISCLENALGDSYYRARFHAAWSLGELKSRRSLPALENALRTEDVRDVRQEMLRVRDGLLGKVPPTPSCPTN